MNLHLLRGRSWPIVCTPYGALCNSQKGCIPGALRGLLLALTYPQWYTRLHVVCLVIQGPRCSPNNFPRDEVLT